MNQSEYYYQCYKSACYRPYYFGHDCQTPAYLSKWNKTTMDMFLDEGCNCSRLKEDNMIKNLVCESHEAIHSWWIQCIYFVMFSVIIAMSIGGNFIVIWIVLAHKRMRTVTNYFLLNLAVADASISLFNVSFSFTNNIYLEWVFGEPYCVFTNFMSVVPTCVSVFTLMSMSLERYFVIVYPLKRCGLCRKKTLTIIVCIWIAACLCGLPMLLYSRTLSYFYETGYENVVCLYDNYPDGDHETSVQLAAYNYFTLFINYILPLTVLTITYTKIGIELWGSQMIGDYRNEINVKAKKKVIKMMIVIVTIFMVCWLPYHLYFTFKTKQLAEALGIHLLINIYWLAMSATVANPVIYVWFSSKFRMGFKYVFRWLPCIRITKEEYYNSELNRDKVLTLVRQTN